MSMVNGCPLIAPLLRTMCFSSTNVYRVSAFGRCAKLAGHRSPAYNSYFIGTSLGGVQDI